MKANIPSRNNVRVKWFAQENVEYTIEHLLELSYSTYTVEQNEHDHTVQFKYVFTNMDAEVPATDIIVFQSGLPTAYARTAGTRGAKFATDLQEDPDVEVKDRIVELTQGKDKITREPPEYPDPRIKEIEIREREDKVKRKILIKNTGINALGHVELKLVETKDVRYVGASPEPNKAEAPEYTWIFQVPAEQSVALDLEFTSRVRKTFKIERERPEKNQVNALPNVKKRELLSRKR